MDIFADYICEHINSAFKYSLFPACLKPADVTALGRFFGLYQVCVFEKSKVTKFLINNKQIVIIL